MFRKLRLKTMEQPSEPRCTSGEWTTLDEMTGTSRLEVGSSNIPDLKSETNLNFLGKQRG